MKKRTLFEDGQVCRSASQGRNTQTTEERRESLQTSYNWVSTGEKLSVVWIKTTYVSTFKTDDMPFIMFLLEGSCDWGHPTLQVDARAARSEQGELDEHPDWAEQEDPIRGSAQIH